MITSLTQLTMSQFVDLLCGDDSVLSPGAVPREDVERTRIRMIYDFTELADPASAARFINRRVRIAKDRAKLKLFQICHNSLEVKAYDEVRDILSEYGIRSGTMTDEELRMEVDRQIKSTERDIAVEDAGDLGTDAHTPDEIRRSYDRQCAFLMTYFKFQIDMGTIKASQFACMIDQATRELRAKQAALSKRR